MAPSCKHAASAQKTAGSPYNSVFAAHWSSSPPLLFVAALQGYLQKIIGQADYEEAVQAQLGTVQVKVPIFSRSPVPVDSQYSLVFLGSRKSRKDSGHAALAGDTNTTALAHD